jgi:hypothetical protein
MAPLFVADLSRLLQTAFDEIGPAADTWPRLPQKDFAGLWRCEGDFLRQV